MYETDLWPFVKAKHVGAKRNGTTRLIVIHTMEAPEGDQTAENIARYFASMPDGRVASAHLCIDNNSIGQCVYDSYVAYAAPGANHDGLQIELAGVANQTRAQWRDKYSLSLLALAADAVAQYSLKFNIPLVKLTDHELRDGRRGIIGHDQASRVYKKSTHTDPGGNFPWARFIAWAQAMREERKQA
jgi:N-acetyl-anhydromuramyl-L-alanine amidase AmpD